jgi:hypothetical protein
MFMHVGLCLDQETLNRAIEADGKRPIECYAQFVDQTGAPVANHLIEAEIFSQETNGEFGPRRKIPNIMTDAEGKIQITGLVGGYLHLTLIDPKYIHVSDDPNELHGVLLRYSKSDGPGQTEHGDINHPIQFDVWKREGPQALKKLRGEVRIPYDGKPLRMDLEKGKLVSEGGDVIITIEMPLSDKEKRENANALGNFPYTCQVNFLNGGVHALTDYSDYFKILGVIGNDFQNTFTGGPTKIFGTLQLRNGKIHGKISLDIAVEDIKRGSGRVIVDIHDSLLNFSGSVSLEIDPSHLEKMTLSDGREIPDEKKK